MGRNNCGSINADNGDGDDGDGDAFDGDGNAFRDKGGAGEIIIDLDIKSPELSLATIAEEGELFSLDAANHIKMARRKEVSISKKLVRKGQTMSHH